MNDLGKFIKSLIGSEVGEIHTTLPAKIESYDAERLRADVVLLAKNNLEGEMVEIPPILNCPVQVFKAGSFIIRPPYRRGDITKVDFSEKALDKLMITGESEDVEYTRTHSLDDAIVAGGLRCESEVKMPDNHQNDLYIANIDNVCELVIQQDGNLVAKNEGNKLTMNSSGDIEVETDNNVDINANKVNIDCSDIRLGGSNGLALIDELNGLINTYNAHTHVAPGGTTLVPNQLENAKTGTQKVGAE